MNDLSQAWARNRIKHSQSNSGDVTAHWCRLLQNNQSQASTLDWTAYRILSGDDTAWQAATLNMRRGTQASQWTQVHQFEEIFFELSSLDKQRSYHVLKEHLTNNAPALARLSRYEAFLDLDSGDPKATDPMQLVVSLARITVSSTYRRHEVLVRTLDRISEEPIRWRRAAIEVLKQPKFSGIEPDIIKHIVSMLDYEDMHIERQRARRRKFQLLYGFKLVVDKVKRLSTSIIWIAIASAMLAFVLIEGRPTAKPEQEDPELKAQRLQQLYLDIVAEFESKNVQTSSDVESPASSTSTDPNQLRTMQLRWRDTAIVEGHTGLDRIQTELQQQLSLANKTGSQSEINVQRAYLVQFNAWRHLVGNALVTSKSSPESGQ